MLRFACTFSKADSREKKRRSWQEGVFQFAQSSGVGVLLDDSNARLVSTKVKDPSLQFVYGAEFSLGHYDILLDTELAVSEMENSGGPTAFISHTSKKQKLEAVQPQPPVMGHPARPPLQAVSTLPRGAFKPPTSLSSSSSSSTTFSSTTFCPPKSTNPVAFSAAAPAEVAIDSVLFKKMRQHQQIGSRFMLDCLKGKLVSSEASPKKAAATAAAAAAAAAAGSDDCDADADSDEDDFEVKAPSAASVSPKAAKERVFTGCICADEMGLGKTLQAISILAAFTKTKKSRGIIVCPSSLIANWQKEVQKWMSVSMVPLVITAGGNPPPVEKIRSFATNVKSYVMILSYEMFRKHSDELNNISNLEVIVLDEAHKIKALADTKTSAAMRSCRATRRLLLTGSPIQNNLDELYALVSFACPGYLFSISSFRQKYAIPIQEGNAPHATSSDKLRGKRAGNKLNQVLSHIMIRRTQTEVLKAVLPPRIDVVLFVALSSAQAEEYAAAAGKVLGPDSPISGNRNDEADEAEEFLPTEMVLPTLQNLRRICNYASLPPDPSIALAADNAEKAKDFAAQQASLLQAKSELKPGQFRPPARVFLPQQSAESKPASTWKVDIPDVLRKSSKITVLDELLQIIRKHSPSEKVVIVSHFTETLNLVEQLAAFRGYETLMLQGDVKISDRQSLVDRFNRPTDPAFLFLLSSRAGGVGLNLPGGSRLVAMDVDWNPAVDIQAQARIWREGQKRPCFVYRLCADRMMEERMLERQSDKGGLVTSVMQGDSDVSSRAVDCDEQQGKASEGEHQPAAPRDKKALVDLIYPRGRKEPLPSDSVAMGSLEYDPILAKLHERLAAIIPRIVDCTR